MNHGVIASQNILAANLPGANVVTRMVPILESLKDREIRRFDAGQFIIRQHETSEILFFLIDGAVEVLKGNVRVATASQPGAVFGEMAVMLRVPHLACVRAVKPSVFYIVESPREFLKSSPAICLHICELMARRLDTLNKYLVDVKQQFDGSDHIGMVDEVLDALMHRHPVDRVRPCESTIRRGQVPD